MKTCNEILGSQRPSKIRRCADILNDKSLRRRDGYIEFNYFTDFLDVDITDINNEYIKETYLNFIYFISLTRFLEKYDKLCSERRGHFVLYFRYLNTLGPTYKPMNKDQLRNILMVYDKYGSIFSMSLNWIDTSEIKDMSYLFKDLFFVSCDANVSKWDVSNVVDMRGIFENLNICFDISNWKLHPLVKVNKETIGKCDKFKVQQFVDLSPYYKRFCKYYIKKYVKIIYKQLRKFFNYE